MLALFLFKFLLEINAYVPPWIKVVYKFLTISMAQCRVRTINLAMMPLDSLKKMCKSPKVRDKKSDPSSCPKQEAIPAPPMPVSFRKILVCPINPVKFQSPPVPCVCPPCPPCKTYLERSLGLLKTGVKLFVVYVALKWTIDNKLWGSHDDTSELIIGFIQSNFPTEGVDATLPDMQRLRYKIIQGWNKLAGNFFYYTFGVPVKMFAQLRDSIMIPEEVLEGGDSEYCPHVTRENK